MAIPTLEATQQEDPDDEGDVTVHPSLAVGDDPFV